jgi:hypothetical protein
MRANIDIFPLAAGLLDYLRPLDLGAECRGWRDSGQTPKSKTNAKIVGLDAYQLAVLISVAAAILSLWI